MLESPAKRLWTARYNYKEGCLLAKHEHDYFQAIYFVASSGDFSLGGEAYLIKPGSVVRIKPNNLCFLKAAPPSSSYGSSRPC